MDDNDATMMFICFVLAAIYFGLSFAQRFVVSEFHLKQMKSSGFPRHIGNFLFALRKKLAKKINQFCGWIADKINEFE